MLILGIETSCDDTCVSIIRASGRTRPCFRILSNIVSSQVEIHKKWGGVYPTLAKREHQRNLTPVLKQALLKARLLKSKIKNKKLKIGLIAVTIGPGLEPCLWVGVNFARELARNWNLPIIPVNHIEAHILANLLPSIRSKSKIIEFPSICLVVSGGHTQLILMRDFGKYKILGETRDDAAGECFDKVARILGLSYPGGPAIEAYVANLNLKSLIFNLRLPRPMIYQKNYDFSFSGLKTAVLYNWRSQPLKVRKSKEYIREMCAEVQQAVIDVLIYKTIKAAKNFKAKSVILGGGVAANKELRNQFKEKIKKDLPNIQYLIPNIQFCTDNAAMVAIAAYFHWLKGETKRWKNIEAEANLRV